MTLTLFKAERLNENLVGLVVNGMIQDMWVRCKLREKARDCWRCGRKIAAKGAAFRPLGEHVHRMRRLCVACVDEIAPVKS